MFSPTLGRWIQNDPIEFEAGDPNLYRFVGNDPVNQTDPSGLQSYLPSGREPGGPKYIPPPKNTGNTLIWMAEQYAKKHLEPCNKECAAKFVQDVKDLVAIAESTPKDKVIEGCHDWTDAVVQKFKTDAKGYRIGGHLRGDPKCKDVFGIKVNQKFFEHDLAGIPWTSWRLGHAVIEVELPDGSKFYLDNGWWGNYFTEKDIPWYVSPYNPK